MTRRRAIAVVKAVFAWARKQGLVSTDPLFALEKPPMSSRPRCSGRAELDQIRPWVRSKEFLAYLEVLAACGCRPSELSRLEARDLRPDLMAGVLDVHKNSGRKQGARVVYFSAAAWKLVEERARLRPTGPLFRTRRDRPWSDSARNTQIRGIRARAKRAGVALPSFNSYSFRHGFITDGLENGATASELAALVGNSSREIDRTYDHLRKRQPAMRAVLDRVRPSE
jgi:integrase